MTFWGQAVCKCDTNKTDQGPKMGVERNALGW